MPTEAAVAVRPSPADGPDDSAKRRQIMDGARAVFLAQGFDAASMGEIARAAGVSKGTLYVYFENKEELFEAIVHEQCEVQAEGLFDLDPDDPDVEAVLTRLGTAFVKFLCQPGKASPMAPGSRERGPHAGVGQAFLGAGPRLRHRDGGVLYQVEGRRRRAGGRRLRGRCRAVSRFLPIHAVQAGAVQLRPSPVGG